MIKPIFSRVMWVGRATVFTVGLAVMLALMLGVATVALAAVPGDPFKLGRSNTINRLSTLVGRVDDAMLRIDNNSAGPNAAALSLQVESGKPPMKVNATAGKATNLNADKLDGNTAEDFYYYNEKVNDSAHADYADSAGEAQNAQVATDSERLDGKDSTDFFSADSSYVKEETTTIPGNNLIYAEIPRCDTGDLALSAGFQNMDVRTQVLTSMPYGEVNWYFELTNPSVSDDLTLKLRCADFPPLRP